MENDNEHKNTTYLWNAVNRAIRIRKERKNADEQENYLRNELSATGVPATPAKAKAKTKAKAKAAKAAKEVEPAVPAPPVPSDWTLVRGRSKSKGPKTDADIAKVCWFTIGRAVPEMGANSTTPLCRRRTRRGRLRLRDLVLLVLPKDLVKLRGKANPRVVRGSPRGHGAEPRRLRLADEVDRQELPRPTSDGAVHFSLDHVLGPLASSSI
jgi:hypothetical protein